MAGMYTGCSSVLFCYKFGPLTSLSSQCVVCTKDNIIMTSIRSQATPGQENLSSVGARTSGNLVAPAHHSAHNLSQQAIFHMLSIELVSWPGAYAVKGCDLHAVDAAYAMHRLQVAQPQQSNMHLFIPLVLQHTWPGLETL